MTDPAWQEYPQGPWPPDEVIPYPEDPKPPKWPWIVAGVSVLAVLAIALTSILVITRRTEVAAPTTVTVTPSITWTGPNDVPLPSTTEPPPTTTEPPPPPNPSTGVQTTPTTTEAPPVPTTTEAPKPVPTTGEGPGGSGHGGKSVTYSAWGSGADPMPPHFGLKVSYWTGTELVTIQDIKLPWGVSVTITNSAASPRMVVDWGEASCSITIDGDVVATNSGPMGAVCVAP